MAQVKFLDYEGLARYDALIKALIQSGDQELLDMINDIKDAIEGSDADSVDSRIADLKEALENKIADLKTELEGDIDSAIAGVIDGAPEILDTLKEVADWIASDEAGVADLISKVAANRTDIDAAANAFAVLDEKVEDQSDKLDEHDTKLDEHDDRLAIVEALVGAAGDSEKESLVDRLDGIDERLDEIESIPIADIEGLFA